MFRLLPLFLWLSLGVVPPGVAAPGEDEEIEDLLSGFEEEEEIFAAQEPTAAPAKKPRFWDLTGSAGVSSSVNYLDHRSATGTDYTDLQKLRTRLNLQLDLGLPRGWKSRLGGYVFYDFAYLIQGRGKYTDQVLDEYEWEVDSQEMYLRGPLGDNLDLKIGRQIVNWGRSETLRILDVLNPLDNREPGLADIQDLRLPVAMVRLDSYWGDWTFTAIAIPEIRFDKLPPLGSDFVPFASALEIPPEQVPNESADNTQWAASAAGIFHQWDVSFHFARYWEDWARTAPVPPTEENPTGLVQKHSRLILAGTGANYTIGSWLFKTELAYIDGVDYPVSETFVETDLGIVPVQDGVVDKSRFDALGGIEYYGFADTTLTVEVANRHINNFESRMRPFDARADSLEMNARITADFLHARLHTLALGVVFGEKAQNGSLVRLSAAYELRDALTVGGGLLLFQNGKPIEFSAVGKNDRVFAEVKYSF